MTTTCGSTERGQHRGRLPRLPPERHPPEISQLPRWILTTVCGSRIGGASTCHRCHFTDEHLETRVKCQLPQAACTDSFLRARRCACARLTAHSSVRQTVSPDICLSARLSVLPPLPPTHLSTLSFVRHPSTCSSIHPSTIYPSAHPSPYLVIQSSIQHHLSTRPSAYLPPLCPYPSSV